ncbi:hypothetical protein [Candidatus Promineifilum breve]|nr:hypothetical protein [Candidatus Promineifilum breve]
MIVVIRRRLVHKVSPPVVVFIAVAKRIAKRRFIASLKLRLFRHRL